jgi:hypothetical protein
MGQYSLRASPACLPLTTVTSTCAAAIAVGHALQMPWSVDGAQASPEPLPMPTLGNAPISAVADALLIDKRCDASGL